MEFESFSLGEEASRHFDITPSMLDAFVSLSTDDSPIHVDETAAKARGFPGRVAHGALLGALVSGVVGTELPGARGLIHSVELKFKRPSCVGDRVQVVVGVSEKIVSVRVLILKVRILDQQQRALATGRVQVGLAEPAATENEK